MDLQLHIIFVCFSTYSLCPTVTSTQKYSAALETRSKTRRIFMIKKYFFFFKLLSISYLSPVNTLSESFWSSLKHELTGNSPTMCSQTLIAIYVIGKLFWNDTIAIKGNPIEWLVFLFHMSVMQQFFSPSNSTLPFQIAFP